MIHASLFSGIGGFDLAANWVGWDNAFTCEIDPFCNKILSHYWPDIDHHSNIKTTCFTQYEGKIDVLSGGFPCQPFSVAGKQKGTGDDRYLWPEMLRAIREIKPQWVVGENVHGIITWSEGMVFEQVCTDLEAEGFKVVPFLLPACGVNAPHQRYRTWFIAYCHDNKCFTRSSLDKQRGQTASTNGCTVSGNTDSAWRTLSTKTWDNFPTQSGVCSRDDGIPGGLDGITFPKWRKESIKGYGNAVVPVLVKQIFDAINKYEKYGFLF